MIDSVVVSSDLRPYVLDSGKERSSRRDSEELRVEPLLLRVERSQLRWFKSSLDVSLGRSFRVVHQGVDPGADPGRAGEIVSQGAWERLVSPRRSWWM